MIAGVAQWQIISQCCVYVVISYYMRPEWITAIPSSIGGLPHSHVASHRHAEAPLLLLPNTTGMAAVQVGA